MPFVLPPLPYEPDALEPYISRKTIELHHGKYQGTYVINPFSRIIAGSFGSVQFFKDHFIKAGTCLFGSVWAWLFIGLPPKTFPTEMN